MENVSVSPESLAADQVAAYLARTGQDPKNFEVDLAVSAIVDIVEYARQANPGTIARHLSDQDVETVVETYRVRVAR